MVEVFAQLAQSVREFVFGQGAHRLDVTSETRLYALYGQALEESILRDDAIQHRR